MERKSARVAATSAVAIGVCVWLSACTRSHVAAYAEGAAGSSGEGATATAGTTSTTGGSATASGTQATALATGTGDDASSGAVACMLPPSLPGCDEAADPLRALEVACVDDVSAAEFRSDDDDAWRRAREFGNAFWVSEDSEAILVLSTGRLPEPNSAGQVVVALGGAESEAVDNSNPNAAALPEPMVTTPGSTVPYEDCDGVGDCSHTLEAAVAGAENVSDLVWLRFNAKVPEDVVGYSVEVGFLSAEYPERVGEVGNSTFVWWTTSELFTGNLATWNGAAANVTGLADRLAAFTDGHPILTRTGFDGISETACPGMPARECPVGAATGWMTLRGPAVPGETLDIAVALFEQDPDASPETVVLLDDWRWSCNRCTLGESCGLQ